MGAGPAVVVLHGLFGMLDNWQGIGRKLAENHTVLLMDLRNHGRSPHHDEFNYPLMASDVAETLEEEGIREASVIGHSMGGKTAMQLAFDFPDLIKGLIVADIGIKTYPAGHEEIFAGLNALNPGSISKRSEAETLLAEKVWDAGVRQFLLKNLSKEKDGGYRWKMNLPVLYDAYEAIRGPVDSDFGYDGPTLFIRGSESNYILEEDWMDIHDHFPEARLETLEGAGHWLHADKPQEFFKVASDFLESL